MLFDIDKLAAAITPREGWPKAVADLVRPYAIAAIATATAEAIWVQAPEGVVVAAGTILVALYGTRALENHGTAKAAKEVKIAEVNAAAPADPGAQP